MVKRHDKRLSIIQLHDTTAKQMQLFHFFFLQNVASAGCLMHYQKKEAIYYVMPFVIGAWLTQSLQQTEFLKVFELLHMTQYKTRKNAKLRRLCSVHTFFLFMIDGVVRWYWNKECPFAATQSATMDAFVKYIFCEQCLQMCRLFQL